MGRLLDRVIRAFACEPEVLPRAEFKTPLPSAPGLKVRVSDLELDADGYVKGFRLEDGDLLSVAAPVPNPKGFADWRKDLGPEGRERVDALKAELMPVEDVGMMRAVGETRKGDWMETSTGVRFYPLDPRPEEVYVEDIAHHLSRINRYNGAQRIEHYTVAEHSVKMAMWVLVDTNDMHLAFEALMHDACEAYIGDMVRPLKRNMPDFETAEENLWKKAIAPRFGLPRVLSPFVKAADNRILVDERRQVMNPSPNPWGIDGLEPLGIVIDGWRPDDAKRMFLQTFNMLWEAIET
jgi:hypothetical protein